MCHDDVSIEKNTIILPGYGKLINENFQGYLLKTTENYKLTKGFNFVNKSSTV